MYRADITTAARFAARALTQPPPTEVAEVARVHDLLTDLAVVLTHTTSVATGLHPAHRPGPTVVDLARRPEQVLLDQLAAHAATSRTGPPTPDGHGGAGTAASRWAGHPTDPAAPAGPVALWQGAVVHAFLAAADLDRPGHRLDDPAKMGGPVRHREPGPSPRRRRRRPAPPGRGPGRARTGCTTGTPAWPWPPAKWPSSPHPPARPTRPGPAFRAPPARVVIVTELDRLAPAIYQLARILTVAPASAEDLISVTRALAHTARAAATVAARAVDSPTVATSAGAGRTAVELTRHADQLTAAVAAAHHRLASLDRASGLATAQARELATAAVPRLHAAARRPDLAAATVPALHAYTAAAPAAVRALAAAITALHTSGALCVRDRSRDAAPRLWRRTGPGDLTAVLTHLADAAAALPGQAAAAPPTCPSPDRDLTRASAPPPQAETPGSPAGLAAADPARVLDAAIRRRHAERRPVRPGMNLGPAQPNTLGYLRR